MNARALAVMLLAASTALVACAAEGEPTDVADGDSDALSGHTVGDAMLAGGCTTSAVAGLARQIIDEANCLDSGAFVPLPSRPNLNLGGAVWPYLEAPARDALVAALDSRPDVSLSVSSMLRTLPQQVLLSNWYRRGLCGIEAAASPGRSNHESGLAIDVGNYGTWRATLESHGFRWLGASDDVHFDYRGPGARDLRGLDVLAFQRLWNRNHPEDLIAEDGDYGPQTEARILASPAEGFAIGGTCGEPAPPAAPAPAPPPAPAPSPPSKPATDSCTWLRGDAQEALTVGQHRDSCDGRFTLILQDDGNLVLYKTGVGPLWATNTVGRGSSLAVMQADGNFVLYSSSGDALWSTKTYGSPGADLAVQNDGNLVVYSAAGAPLWDSKTCCH